MKYLATCIHLGILGWLLWPSPTFAKQPAVTAIGNIQNMKEVEGAGCSLHRQGEQKKVVFWSESEKSALMNIDGKDRRLQLVSKTRSLQRVKKGDRSTLIYKAGKINVRIDRVATFVCPRGSQECEVTGYNAKIKLNIGDRQQIMAVEGDCGS